jgi:hypothetical protein
LEFYDTQYTLLKAESLADRVGVALKLAEQEAFFESHGVEGSERPEVAIPERVDAKVFAETLLGFQDYGAEAAA